MQDQDIEVTTQVDFETALAAGRCAICLSGSYRLTTMGDEKPRIVLRAATALHVVALESSQPCVVAWGSSQPHVEARGSSQPCVVAWGSSQPHVEARESSQPCVEAWGFAQLSVFGAVRAQLSAHCSVLMHGSGAQVTGGHQIIVRIQNVQEWCEFYGVDVENDVVILYKALNDDFMSPRGFSYQPGTVPVAPDWDGGEKECGNGLHFSPSPMMALEFYQAATKFVGCPVALKDLVVHPNGDYLQKVKASRCCGPVYEVNRRGQRI